MRIIKITSLGCSSCLIVNEILAGLNDIEIINLDYDFDNEKVRKYNPGKILPVLIFEKDNKEVDRLIGEQTKEKIVALIERYR